LQKYLSELQTLTLPLSEEGIFHHSKIVSKEDELALHQGLGAYVCELLICSISPHLLVGYFLKVGGLLVNDVGHQSHIRRKHLRRPALPKYGLGRLNMISSIPQGLLKPPRPLD
jgi:hypothetical protein